MPYRRGAVAVAVHGGGHGGDQDQHTHAGRRVGLASARLVSPAIFALAAYRRGGGGGGGSGGARRSVPAGPVGFLWPHPGPKPELHQGLCHTTTASTAAAMSKNVLPPEQETPSAASGVDALTKISQSPSTAFRCDLPVQERAKQETPSALVSFSEISQCPLPAQERERRRAAGRGRRTRQGSRKKRRRRRRTRRGGRKKRRGRRRTRRGGRKTRRRRRRTWRGGRKTRRRRRRTSRPARQRKKCRLRRRSLRETRSAASDVVAESCKQHIASNHVVKTKVTNVHGCDGIRPFESNEYFVFDKERFSADGRGARTTSLYLPMEVGQKYPLEWKSKKTILCRDQVCENHVSGILLQEMDTIQKSKASTSLEKASLPPAAFLVDHDRDDMVDKGQKIHSCAVLNYNDPAVVRERFKKTKRVAKVEIVFPNQSLPIDVKEDDTLKCVLATLEVPLYPDAYYTFGGKLLDVDIPLSQSILLLSGLRIIVHPRLRGGSGEGSSSQGVSGEGSSSQGGSIEASRVSIHCARSVPVQRQRSFVEYMDEGKNSVDWLEVVEIPKELHVTSNGDSFVVALGTSGRTTLRLLLECLERKWKRRKTLRGEFTVENIVFLVEYGIIEIECEEHDIDQQGFRLDCRVLRDLIKIHFKYFHNTKGFVYPMFVEGLWSELECAGIEDGYMFDDDKRSLLHNNAATMTFERRSQITTHVIRYWRALGYQNRKNFEGALKVNAQGQVMKAAWIAYIHPDSKILIGRLFYNGTNSYEDQILSFWAYSRCVYEHGPTPDVSEKQCEAALYLLNRYMFQHIQRQILTKYVEVEPVTIGSGAQYPMAIVAVSPVQPRVEVPESQVHQAIDAPLPHVPPPAVAAGIPPTTRFIPSAVAKAKANATLPRVPPPAVAAGIPPPTRFIPSAAVAKVKANAPVPHVPARGTAAAPSTGKADPRLRLASQDVPDIRVSNRLDIKRVFSKY